MNHAQFVGRLDGTVIVPTYDWAKFFDAPFKQTALKDIKSMHHLTFTDAKLESAIVKDTVDSPEREIRLIQNSSWKPIKDSVPPIIPPPGLSRERRQYLFEKIRKFCPPHCQDLVYPDPAQEYSTPPTPKRRRPQ